MNKEIFENNKPFKYQDFLRTLQLNQGEDVLQLNQGKDALRVVAYVTIYLVAFNNSLLFGFQKFFMEIRQSKEKKNTKQET